MGKERVSIPRLRSVKFKSGGEVRLLNTNIDERRKEIERHCREVIDIQEKIEGFAIVAWDKDGKSTCYAANYESPIPHILIPEFVKSRLLAHRIELWVMEDIQ